jgi:hypothetical protein
MLEIKLTEVMREIAAFESDLFTEEQKRSESYLRALREMKNEATSLEKELAVQSEKNKGLNRYVIFDVNTGIFGDDDIVYAKNSRQAVEKLIKEKGIEGTIKRSNSYRGRFVVTKSFVQNGDAYKTGRDVWYGLWA